MFCTACAAPLSINDRYCGNCGRQVFARASESDAGRPARRARAGYDRPSSSRLVVRLLYLAPIIGLLTAVSAFGLHAFAEQRSQADAYRRAESAYAEGRLIDARQLFADAGGYRDAPDRAAALDSDLQPYRERYDEGELALSSGDYATAIDLLLPVARDLPEYRDVLGLLEEARRSWSDQLLAQARAAVQQGDWHVAEQLYAAVAAENPYDPAIQQTVLDFQRDHSSFIYTFNHEIRVSTASGDEPAVVSDSVAAAWPVWSPDRSRIAFISPGDMSNGYQRSLYVMQSDGTGLHKLADDPARWRAPTWSPDGTKIAFETDGPTDRDPTSATTIKIIDLTTGVVDDILDGVFPNAISPTWSPSGDKIAFVVRIPARLDSGVSAPDGTGRAQISEIYVKDLATGRIEAIGDGLVPRPWRISWSPTSNDILVYSREDGTSFREGALYLLDAATGEFTPVDVSSIQVSMPVWSPDGQRFAYVIHGDLIRIVGIDGTARALSTAMNLTGALTWSPSSDRLLAVGASGIGESLLVDLTPTGIETSVITLMFDSDGGDSGPPQWSPATSARTTGIPTTAGTALDPGR